MNKKIKKYLDEIAKTEKKIADLQQYLRGVQAALKQEEDNEMIRCIRGMKMENGQLYDLLDGIQNGTVKFQVSRESDEEGSGSFVSVSYTHLDVYKRQMQMFTDCSRRLT